MKVQIFTYHLCLFKGLRLVIVSIYTYIYPLSLGGVEIWGILERPQIDETLWVDTHDTYVSQVYYILNSTFWMVLEGISRDLQPWYLVWVVVNYQKRSTACTSKSEHASITNSASMHIILYFFFSHLMQRIG